MPKNEYGLDAHYFKKKLNTIVRDVDCYRPDEMMRELSKLVCVAASQANLDVEIKTTFKET